VIDRINRGYRARVWRRRWIFVLVTAGVLVLLGLGATTIWVRMSSGGAADKQEAGSVSPAVDKDR
jgi:hypothetical protein